MSTGTDLKTLLDKLHFTDDAKVVQQITEHTRQVKGRMDQIRHKIMVLSGKGGVGKSTVSVSLALAFARMGLRVGILDVDLNGPCVPKMLGMKGYRFDFTPEGVLPPLGPRGIKVASMEFFLKEGQPVRWKGSMNLSPVWLGMLEMNVIREFLADLVWGELDLLLADLPPGAAADKPPALAGFIPDLDGAVVVTTPSEVTRDVVAKSIQYTRDIGIRVLGLIENMSGVLCPECGTESAIFDGDCRELCEQSGVSLLGQIPLDRRISRACDQGLALLESYKEISGRFDEIAEKIAGVVGIKDSKG